MKRILAIAFAILLIVLVVGCEPQETGNNLKTTTPSTESPDTRSTVPETTTTTTSVTKKSEQVYSDGQYKVGVDIPEGVYLLLGYDDRSSYFSVNKSPDGNTIINDNFKSFSYISVKAGEYLTLSRCDAVDGNKKQPRIDDIYEIRDGMYLIGRDLPAGEYKLKGVRDGSKGYYAVTDSRHDVYRNDFFSGTAYVKVSKGEFLKLSGALIIIAPDSK